MSLVVDAREPNLWEEICKGYDRPPYDDDTASVVTDQENYDPAKVTPVFYGKMFAKVETNDVVVTEDFDPAISHPASIGYAFVDRPPVSPVPSPIPPNKETCTPREFLEYYIFPVLLPAMHDMLQQAKIEKCFERKRTKFDALDFLTEYLYRNNPGHDDRAETFLLDIPFVQEWLKDHPRPPLPWSLLWTDEEGALIIQSFWRGYKARCDPEIQELRQWQKQWRLENEDIKAKVSNFWADKISEDPADGDNDSEKQDTVQSNSPQETAQNDQNDAETNQDNPTETTTDSVDPAKNSNSSQDVSSAENEESSKDT